MMTMCPTCYELHSDIWSKPCCRCADKTVPVEPELIISVQLFLERGFNVTSATYYQEGTGSDCIEIEIRFGKLYTDNLFSELQLDWSVTDEYPVVGDELGEPHSILSCRVEQTTDESIETQKEQVIRSLELWLDERDPQACKSLIASTLYSGAGLYGYFNFSTALGATYIGRPKLLFTSAMYAVCILKPYFFLHTLVSAYMSHGLVVFFGLRTPFSR